MFQLVRRYTVYFSPCGEIAPPVHEIQIVIKKRVNLQLLHLINHYTTTRSLQTCHSIVFIKLPALTMFHQSPVTTAQCNFQLETEGEPLENLQMQWIGVYTLKERSQANNREWFSSLGVRLGTNNTSSEGRLQNV